MKCSGSLHDVWHLCLFIGVITLSPTGWGGAPHGLLPNVNSEAAKCTFPHKLGFGLLGTLFVSIGLKLHSVHLVVKHFISRQPTVKTESAIKNKAVGILEHMYNTWHWKQNLESEKFSVEQGRVIKK